MTRPRTLRIATLAAIGAVVTLAGCNRPQAPAGAMEAAPQAERTAAKGANGMLSVSPGQLTCTGSVAEVAWNATTNPAVKMIEVRIGEGPEAKLFTTQMPVGSAETGPWAISGMLLVLRNAADGSELDRVTVAGPACAPPVATATPTTTAPTAAEAPAAVPAN